MPIHVTPIPRLTVLTTPAFTLGTANTAGSAITGVASDSTLLAFDTTLPAAVGTAATGSAVVAGRRDHSHAGIPGAGTVVDNAITRFDGTGGSAIQGYTSNSPTISDAGVITLAAGQLVFPATQAASAGVTTLDDYEEGTFTPGLADDSLDPTGEGQNYTQALGRYTKIGNRVLFNIKLLMGSLGTLNTAQEARITGLPFTSQNTSNTRNSVTIGLAKNLALTSTGESGTGFITHNTDYIRLQVWSITTGTDGWAISEISADGDLAISGQYETAT